MSPILVIARRELGAQLRGALAWSVPTIGLLGITLAIQPEMSKSGSLFEAKLALLPPEVLAGFGMQTTRLSDPLVWLATNFTTPALLAGLFAGLLGASLLAREEQHHTAELLLVQPVSRAVIVLGKVLAAVALSFAVTAVMTIVSLAIYAAIDVGAYDVAGLVLMFLGLWWCELVVLALSLVASVLVPRARSATAVGLGVTFGLWGAGVVGAVSERLSMLAWLSPFHAADPAHITSTGSLPATAFALPLVAFAAVALTIACYRRKDIHA